MMDMGGGGEREGKKDIAGTPGEEVEQGEAEQGEETAEEWEEDSSDEELGRQVLSEVRVLRLDTVLARLKKRSLEQITGIPAIDELLEQLPPQPHQPPHILAITSPHLASGKSHLLYVITILAVLPCTYNSIFLGGKASAAIILDLSHRFSLERVAECCRAHITMAGVALEDAELEAVVSEAMSHVYVFRPRPEVHGLEMLKGLKTWVFDKDNGFRSRERRVGVVGIECIEEIVADNIIHTWNSLLQGIYVSQGAEDVLGIFMKELEALIKELGCWAVFTTSKYMPPPRRRSVPPVAPPLPSMASSPPPPDTQETRVPKAETQPWDNAVTARVVLERVLAQPFERGISVVRALKQRDAGRRTGTVGFRGRVEGVRGGFGVEIGRGVVVFK